MVGLQDLPFALAMFAVLLLSLSIHEAAHAWAADRLGDRRGLLSSVDRLRRDLDASGKMEGMDVFSERAMGILTSSDLFDALDISKEPDAVRERYGTYDASRPKGDGAPRVPQNLLAARRLVEAGVRVVTINYSFWDWHGQNFKNAQEELPIFDQAVSDKSVLTGYHWGMPGAGTLQKDGNGYALVPVSV